jgi:hypothetical protein
MFLPHPLALLFSQVMTTILSLTTYKYKIIINTICDLVPAYGSDDTPDTTLQDQPMGVYGDLSFDYFDFLRVVSCTGTRDEL